MLKTKYDKLLFAVAVVLCVVVAAVFVVDRINQQAPVGNFEKMPREPLNDEDFLIDNELPGRKGNATDENQEEDSVQDTSPASEATEEATTTNAATTIETPTSIPTETEAIKVQTTTEADSGWQEYDLVRYTHMNTRLRAQANADDSTEVIAVLPAGEKVKVTARNDKWSKVIDSQGRKGYILTSLLQKNKPEEEVKPVSVQRTRYTATDLRMRKSPSQDGEYIMTIPGGTALTEISVEGSWSLVVLKDGSKGYVSNQYLTANKPKTAATTAKATASKTTASKTKETSKQTENAFKDNKKTLYATTSLILRSGPGTSYDKLATVSPGTKINQIATNDKWSKVTLANGKSGYMLSSYLSSKKPAESSKPAETTKATSTTKPASTTTKTESTTAGTEKPKLANLNLVKPQGGKFNSAYNRSAAVSNIVRVQKLIKRNTGKAGQSYNTFSINAEEKTITIDGLILNLRSAEPEIKHNTWYGHDKGVLSNKTASGAPTQMGMIATHLEGWGENIPFGTVLFVEGYGIGVIGDVGRLVASETGIDLCVDDFTIKDLLARRLLKNANRRVWYIEP